MPRTALVVEDDRAVFELIRDALNREGLVCERAEDGPAALQALTKATPDLVVLDVSLPGMSGLEVCERIRHSVATARVPVIIVSGLGAEIDHVRGLDVGADDYIDKPFKVQEFLARVRAVLRRAAGPGPTGTLRLGELELDITRRQASVAGASVALTPTEFALLQALMAAEGRALSRNELLATVRGYENPAELESRTIDVHMGRLRAKMGQEARRVLTVRGFGYRLDTS